MGPSEILHQFYELLFEKVLQALQLHILCIGVYKLISECRNQCDRSCSQATHTGKMKGCVVFTYKRQ